MIAAIAALVLTQSYYSPAEAEALFAHANEAYYRDDFATAKADLRKLVEHGFSGPDVLYNLGTAALASGDIGEAVLFLERARKEGGKAADVDANLAVARSKQLDQVVGAQMEEPFLSRLTLAMPEDLVALAFLGTWAGGLLLMLIAQWVSSPRTAALRWVAGAMLIVSAPTGLLLAADVYTRNTVHEGVVMKKTLQARETPRDNSKVAFEIHAGLKVRIVDANGERVLVRLPNGLEGWTDRDGVSEI